MTSTAWLQGSRNALICLSGCFVIWLAIAVVFSFATGRAMSESFIVAVNVLWIPVALLFLATWVYGRMTSGKVLLDCGRHPTWWLFLLLAAFWLVLAIHKYSQATSNAGQFGLTGPIFYFSFVLYWLVMATGRLQVREHGLWQYWGLLRWDKLGSYRWTLDSTLLVTSRRSLFQFWRGALPVRPEQKLTLSELLRQCCPNAAESAA